MFHERQLMSVPSRCAFFCGSLRRHNGLETTVLGIISIFLTYSLEAKLRLCFLSTQDPTLGKRTCGIWLPSEPRVEVPQRPNVTRLCTCSNCRPTTSVFRWREIAGYSRFHPSGSEHLERSNTFLGAYVNSSPAGPAATVPRCLERANDLRHRWVRSATGSAGRMRSLRGPMLGRTS